MTFARRTSRQLTLERLEDRVVPTLVINPTFDASITGDAHAATIESTINQAIQIYETAIADSITVNITFTEMSSGLGENLTYYVPESYSSYLSALLAHENSTADAAALASLPAGPANPVTGGTTIDLRTPLARALGYSDASNANIPMDSTISLNTSICNLSRPDSDSSKFDLLAVTLHEMDEAFGGGSALDGLAQGAAAPTTIQPLDLYRYSADGVRSFNTNAPTGAANQAYFSIDGGKTDLVNFNQYAGGDFGDWYSYPYGASNPPGPQVQDAFQTQGSSPNMGIELTRLDVLGFTLTSSGSGNPVVIPSSANLATNATTLTIEGSGFAGIAAGNKVTFSGGVTGKVARATTTQLIVTGLTGLTAGSLSATVTVGGLSSVSEPVATVVPVVTVNKATLAVKATTLVIHGVGFSPGPANDSVTFSDGGTGIVSSATRTTLTVTGLSGAPAGSLDVTVTSNGASSSSVQVATVPITAPKVSANNVGSTQLTLSWTAVAGATSYKVEYLRPNGTWSLLITVDGSITSETFTVQPASTYTFRVGAADAYATAFSIPLKVTSFTVAPTVSYTTTAATQITLFWNSLPGTTEYLIKEQQANGTYKTLYTLGRTFTQYTFIEPPGGTNQYLVEAVGGHGTLNVTDQTANVTLVNLTWNAVAGATSYEVDQLLANGTWEKLATDNSRTTHQTVITQPGNTYTFRVGAFDAAGPDFSVSVVVTT